MAVRFSINYFLPSYNVAMHFVVMKTYSTFIDSLYTKCTLQMKFFRLLLYTNEIKIIF